MLPEKEIRSRSWKVLAENQTAKKLEVRKMFALKSFSENNQKIESEVWNPEWKMVTLRAQVGVKKQPVTAVKRHGSLLFL